MKKVNLNVAVLDLSGNPAGDDLKLGPVLAQVLSTATKGDALKLYHWALMLHRGESLSLDKSDFKTLRDFVESADTITIQFKAQLLLALDECKELPQIV